MQGKMTENDFDEVWKNLHKLDESNIMMHIMKVMLLLGFCYGLRGGKEISELKTCDIIVERFPANHPLAGQYYVEINVENTKSDKLSVNNTIIQKTHLRMPVLPCT